MSYRLHRFILFGASMVMASTALADPDTGVQPLNISYTPDKVVKEIYVPLLQGAYDAAGVKVRFVETTLEDGIRGLKDEKYDGSVANLLIVAQYYKHIEAIEPALGITDIRLFCRKGKQCSRRVYRDKKLTVGATLGSSFIRSAFPEIRFSISKVEGLKALESGFNQNHYDYFIYASSVASDSNFIKSHITQSIPIAQSKLHHLLNKKHLKVIELISKVLAKRMEPKTTQK